jgi:hypothetical protein
MLAACTVTIESAQTPGVTDQGAAPSGQATASPTATALPTATAVPTASPLPAPIEATWDDLFHQPDGALVAIVGRVRAGPLVSCFNHQCGIFLEDPADSANDVIFELQAVTYGGVPNTMVQLPDTYTEDDLRLTANDGTAIVSGDMMRLVGWVRQGDTQVTLEAVWLETAPEPTLSPTTVTFAELAQLPQGTAVRIRGTLSAPFITSCGSTCAIHLDDPKSSRWAYIDVPVIGEGDAQQNGMLKLPSSFRNKDLKVFASDGTQLGHGDKAWIVGTLDNAPTEDHRSIQVVTIETAS